jgi:large subunit ribosomal protein L5
MSMARLMDRYYSEIQGALGEELGIKNRLAIPRLTKVVVSMGLGKALQEKKRLEAAAQDLATITGQKAVICKAKKSVSNFKLREGYEVGAKVTLRGKRMYEFVDRLINAAVPRTRDFRGLSSTSFDGRGNYSMGLAEQTVFPEINLDKVEFFQGMNITFVTTALNDSDARELLTKMGMPFRRSEEAQQAQQN